MTASDQQQLGKTLFAIAGISHLQTQHGKKAVGEEHQQRRKRYALIDFDAEDFVVSTKLMVLRTISQVDNIVIYNFLTSNEILKQLQHLAESRSGTFPQITFSHVKELRIVLPQGKTLKTYESLAWSIFRQSKANEEQNKILFDLRDTLLPKLMKGEINLNQN